LPLLQLDTSSVAGMLYNQKFEIRGDRRFEPERVRNVMDGISESLVVALRAIEPQEGGISLLIRLRSYEVTYMGKNLGAFLSGSRGKSSAGLT
jgi:hypothetical protein